VESPAHSAPIRNRLIERLPRLRRAGLIAGCERVQLGAREILGARGEEMRSVYFPTGSSISSLVPVDAAFPPEVMLAGSEGFYGIAVALGMTISPVHALVQEPGSAWRMGSVAFRRELARTPALARRHRPLRLRDHGAAHAKRRMQPFPRRAAAGGEAAAHDGRPGAFGHRST
jgi:hypothetical protein